MNWTVAGLSFVAVLGIAAAAWALGLGGASFADERAAMDEAEGQVPGFYAVSAVMSADGAEVTGDDGRVLVLRRLGARWVADA